MSAHLIDCKRLRICYFNILRVKVDFRNVEFIWTYLNIFGIFELILI